MAKKTSELDQAAELLKVIAESISEQQVGAPTIVELAHCMDGDIVGCHPQAIPSEGSFIDDGGLYLDRFPEPLRQPIQLNLEADAKLTDFLSESTSYDCILMNQMALDLVKQFDLGNARLCDAIVRGASGRETEYTYLFHCNHIALEDINFSESSVFLVDMIGQPIEPVTVDSPGDYQAKLKLARAGDLPNSERFSRLSFAKIVLHPESIPTACIFGMGRWDTRVYVSSSLKEAILDAGLRGLEFRTNTRLFFTENQ